MERMRSRTPSVASSQSSKKDIAKHGEMSETTSQMNDDVQGYPISDEVESAIPRPSIMEEQQIAALNLLLGRGTVDVDGPENLTLRSYGGQSDMSLGLVPWYPTETKESMPPSDYTVTQIRQTHDLLRGQDIPAGVAEKQNSKEWLATHSIDSLDINIESLIKKGKPCKPKLNQVTGQLLQHLQFESVDIVELEYRLHLAIEVYTKRVKWCNQGSRRVFGLIQGERVGLVADASNANCGFGRLRPYQDSLIHLIDEQFSNKTSIYLTQFGTRAESLWKLPMDVNCRSLDEAKTFVQGISASGGCNLLAGLKHVMRTPKLDQVVMVLGSCPDQSADVLVDYVQQLSVGRRVPIHTVAYDCNNHLTNLTLKKISETTDGRYHCFSSACEEQIYTSTDITLLLKEIQKAQDVLAKIKEMRKGLLDNTLVSIMNEISDEIQKLPQSRFLPRPPGHDTPLTLEKPRFQPMTSIDWLRENGLKAKKLDLYQILAPNAYSYREEFIPVIKKTVQSQIHEKAMAQFDWYDGSVKNVHVDLAQLFEYQKQLGAQVKLLEKRINWLASASRRIFGTITEKNVVFLLDLSISNINYLVHIQNSLRLLMEEQMGNKEFFNIIAFGSEAKAFRPSLVRVTNDTLQAAWKWCLGLECSGSRNFMAALRMALENEEERQHNIGVQGVYLFTSGIPDQPADVTAAYLEEAVCGRQTALHTVLFNVDDYDSSGAIPGRYANITKTADALRYLAHCTGGRFHWFRETGIIENDDIRLLMSEIDRAVNHSRKCKQLVDSVKYKYPNSRRLLKEYEAEAAELERAISSPEAIEDGNRMKSLPGPPRIRSAQRAPRPKAILSSTTPSSTNAVRNITPVPAKPDPMESVAMSKGQFRKTVKSAFYTENKNGIGVVFKEYPNSKSVRKSVGKADIPEKEAQISSKLWMKRFSLKKLGLDLLRLVSGSDCNHDNKLNNVIGKEVYAKYCRGLFPTANVNGTLKHLQFTPMELRNYDAEAMKALKRYLRRLQWLLAGSRRIFGVVVEKRIVVAIDVSGSMDGYMTELKTALKELIWEQLYREHIAFNLIAFSTGLKHWRNKIVEPDEDTCHMAVNWTEQLVAHGNTCTLEAVSASLRQETVDGVYLLTDGKPDVSTGAILQAVSGMDQGRRIPIHTISFNCTDMAANSFLKQLASESGGRYHRVCYDFDAVMFAHRLLSEGGMDDPKYPPLPEFDGDDLRRVATEINLARRYLAQSNYFKDLYFELKSGAP